MSKPPRDDLIKAIENGDLFELDEIINRGADVNEKEEPLQLTPLHYAALQTKDSSVEIITSLIKAGARFDALTTDGFSPLGLA